MNKITKFLFLLLCICLGVYLLMRGYIKDTENVSDKVGSKIGGGELGVTEYYTLAQCFDTYKAYLEKKEYKTAYSMLSQVYRRYVPYDEYEKKVSVKKVSKMQVEDIKTITTTTFDVLVDISGEKEHYSIILDSKNNTFSLFPESFLDYKVVEIDASNKNLNCILKDYVVNIDKTTFNFELENTSRNDEIKISKAILYSTMEDVINTSGDINVLPGETKNISISFETDYMFPDKVSLIRNMGNEEEDIEYSFDIE